MTVRKLTAAFFVLYGLLTPALAFAYFIQYPYVGGSVVVASFLIATLLLGRRATLVNLLIAIYVLRVYLTRPYADLFLNHLQTEQYRYILDTEAYFNGPDANVVYLSLVSLLGGWLVGLKLSTPRPSPPGKIPRVFSMLDRTISDARWPFWFVWILLSFLNYKSPADTWVGMRGEGSSPLFAYGLLGMEAVNFVCLFTVVGAYGGRQRLGRLMLVVPAVVTALVSTAAGSRGAFLNVFIFAAICWLYRNFDEWVSLRQVIQATAMGLLAPAALVIGLIANHVRPMLRYSADAGAIGNATLEACDFRDPNNPVVNDFYSGLTQLMHRAGTLKAQFRILNNHYVHDPLSLYNPIETAKRVVNDFLPGPLKPFDVISINQLFDYIYYDYLPIYNSETWGLQGTLYLYFGHWLAPLVVLYLAILVGRGYRKVEEWAMGSPAFAAFFVLTLYAALEFGTFERVFRVTVVPALISFLFVAWSCRVLGWFGRPVTKERRIAGPA